MNYCPFSSYKNIFGKIGTGAHSYKLFNIAMVDYILTIIISILTTGITQIPIVITTIGWLLIGLILHILFGVSTNTVMWLGLTC